MSTKTPAPHPTITVRDLAPKHDTAVTGGHRAGSDPVKYMEIKLTEVLISG